MCYCQASIPYHGLFSNKSVIQQLVNILLYHMKQDRSKAAFQIQQPLTYTVAINICCSKLSNKL